MSKAFNPSLIEIRNNPFSSTKSVSISTGSFLKDSKSHDTYIPHTDSGINMGLIKKLKEAIAVVEESKGPNHILILAEYGQGKSFTLKKIQDEIFINYHSGLISYSIGGNYQVVEGDDEGFRSLLMEDIEQLFEDIDEDLYTNKEAVRTKYGLANDKNFSQFLAAYDKAFSELNILVYIMIDELDKIVISELTESKVRIFLEDLKSIGDNCSRAISILIAGTPNCLVKMDTLSIDYSQRFRIIEDNFFTPEETAKYVSEKCHSKLTYSGHYPFENRVRKKIFDLTDGNIRRIESICRDMWNFAAREKKKIDNTLFNKYYKTRLFEIVKNTQPPGTSKVIIDFLVDIFVAGGKIGIGAYLTVRSAPKKRVITEFVSANSLILRSNRSFLMSPDFKTIIVEALIT